MSVCQGNCAGGHYAVFTAASLCPANIAESKYINIATLDWGTLAASIVYNINVTPGQIIKDNDILEGLITKVYNEIYRYTQNPRHNASGGQIYFGGSMLPAPGVPPFTIPDEDHIGGMVKHDIWQYIVYNARALQTAYDQPVTLDDTSTDATDQINATYINKIVQVLNNLNDPTGCGTVCRCNVVCNCNGDCACNYSDRRLKENIQPITGESLSERIYDMNTYSYTYNDKVDGLPKTTQYGVMAQDLLELGYDEFVSEEDGYYKVNYQMMIPLMINELQKSRRDKEISNIIATQSFTMITQLEERVENIEKYLSEINRTFKK